MSTNAGAITALCCTFLYGCSALVTIPGYGPGPVGAYAEVCQTDQLINSPFNDTVANLYVGQKLNVYGMYMKDGETFDLVGFQGADNRSAFFSDKTGRLDSAIYLHNGAQRVMPTIRPNNVVLKLNGCK